MTPNFSLHNLNLPEIGVYDRISIQVKALHGIKLHGVFPCLGCAVISSHPERSCPD